MSIPKVVLRTTMLLLASGAAAWGQTVSWTLGSSPPSGWTISPTTPGPTDVVSFAGPTGVYSNSCVGNSNLGGTPSLLINNINKTIELYFQPPAPTMCPLIYMPVCGLQGNLGSLSPGNWTFYSTQPDIAFFKYFTVSASGNVIYVDKNASSFLQNGTSWSLAYTNLQSALAAALPGDEIRVADGTYHPDEGVTPGDRTASFAIPDQVTLKGGYAGYGASNPDARDPNAAPTILSGDLQNNDLWSLLFKDDNSYRVVTATGTSQGTRLDGFTIMAGNAVGASPYERGAGLDVEGGFLDVSNCIFHANTAANGGAIHCENANLYMGNTEIHGNRALVSGGGIYSDTSDVNLVNVLMTGNSCDYDSVFGGAAIYALGSRLNIQDSTLAQNGSGHKAITSFVWGNPSSNVLVVHNSILYNGGDEIWCNNTGLVDVRYSDIQGGYTGTGNISDDPMFVSLGAYSVEGEWYAGNYHLQSGSPCLDSGRNNLRPTDVLDLDENGNTSESLPIDLDGNARVYHTTVDMGAYERQSSGGGGGGWQLLTTIDILYNVPNPAPGIIHITGSGSRTVTSSFKAELKLEMHAASAAGGNWTATFNPDPGTVGPGTETVSFNIDGTNVDTNQLTPGTTGVKVAELEIWTRPASP